MNTTDLADLMDRYLDEFRGTTCCWSNAVETVCAITGASPEQVTQASYRRLFGR